MHSPRETATSMTFFFFLVGGGGFDFPASAPGQGLVLVAWKATIIIPPGGQQVTPLRGPHGQSRDPRPAHQVQDL